MVNQYAVHHMPPTVDVSVNGFIHVVDVVVHAAVAVHVVQKMIKMVMKMI